MSKTVLTVEDDSAIRRGIVDALRFKGYGVLEAGHGDLGHEMAVRQQYDLLLLDLVLPGRGGLEILRAVRATRPTQPVIILTARGEESDRVEGLRAGADDYVVKPFSVKELLARVEAVLRRSPGRPSDMPEVKIP
ncbi:MAG TPA: response regulator, partial [Pirellulaceae bacterium]|nr:response regulator [Pirellulaceae bacterium]